MESCSASSVPHPCSSVERQVRAYHKFCIVASVGVGYQDFAGYEQVLGCTNLNFVHVSTLNQHYTCPALYFCCCRWQCSALYCQSDRYSSTGKWSPN